MAGGSGSTRHGATALLAAAMLGGGLALAGVLVSGPDPTRSPTPTAAVVNAPGPASPSGEPSGSGTAAAPVPNDEPANPKAAQFLKALRAGRIPASTSGFAEIRIAGQACEQLAAGTTEADLARRIPKALPTLTEATAAKFVTAAKKHYC